VPTAVRCCAVVFLAALLSACASVPAATQGCDAPRPAVVASERAAAFDCAAVTIASDLQAVGGVQQRGGQTRTVGVPRGFLVTMIVLLVIFALA